MPNHRVDSGVATSGQFEREQGDGRARRATRTRQLVVETFLDLLEEGEPQPTAQQVSDRSGVSMRSIFRLFDDVEALHAAAITTQIDRVTPLLVQLDGIGPLDRRVKMVVDSRSTLFEAISPVRRMAVRLAPTSRPIRGDLVLANRFLREQIAEVFEPELSAMTAAGRRDAIEMLDAVTSWETWERLRSVQGTPERTTRRIIAGLVRAILPT
jgi:TetR/AcrR family transcriptional regulator of autoinduction and epiphytic fitness